LGELAERQAKGKAHSLVTYKINCP